MKKQFGILLSITLALLSGCGELELALDKERTDLDFQSRITPSPQVVPEIKAEPLPISEPNISVEPQTSLKPIVQASPSLESPSPTLTPDPLLPGGFRVLEPGLEVMHSADMGVPAYRLNAITYDTAIKAQFSHVNYCDYDDTCETTQSSDNPDGAAVFQLDRGEGGWQFLQKSNWDPREEEYIGFDPDEYNSNYHGYIKEALEVSWRVINPFQEEIEIPTQGLMDLIGKQVKFWGMELGDLNAHFSMSRENAFFVYSYLKDDENGESFWAYEFYRYSLAEKTWYKMDLPFKRVSQIAFSRHDKKLYFVGNEVYKPDHTEEWNLLYRLDESFLVDHSTQASTDVEHSVQVLTQPSNVQVEVLSTTAIRLSWDPVPGVFYYTITNQSDETEGFKKETSETSILIHVVSRKYYELAIRSIRKDIRGQVVEESKPFVKGIRTCGTFLEGAVLCTQNPGLF